MCEQCIELNQISPIQHSIFGRSLLDACGQYFFPDQYPTGHSSLGQDSYSPRLADGRHRGMEIFRVAMECPTGDTIGHWTRWCVVPLLVAWIILHPFGALAMPERACYTVTD